LRSKTPQISKSTSSRAGAKAGRRPQISRSRPSVSAPSATASAVGASSTVPVHATSVSEAVTSSEVKKAPAPVSLSPEQEALFRDFQANLLSLISHELRTPLTGILNALGVLEEPTSFGGLSTQDLIKMAKENAVRLQQALSTLLDLGSMDSGSFHVRLREIDLCRLARTRVEFHQPALASRNLTSVWTEDSLQLGALLLADSQRLGRAIDLCFQVLIPRAEPGTQVKIRLTSHKLEIGFQLAKNMEKLWQTTWSGAGIGLNTETKTPYSAFAGVLQSEQAFLSRVEDGFGSEFLLIHEIMQQHHGTFSAQLHSGGAQPAPENFVPEPVSEGDLSLTFETGSFGFENRPSWVELVIELPELKSEEALQKALASRAFQISTELSSVCLVLVNVPKDIKPELFRNKVQSRLVRATDGVYVLPAKRQVALVLDDCNPEDVIKLMQRVSTQLGHSLVYGSAQCPQDGLDPEALVALAQERIKQKV
jgi:hypothetical protein